ncbi:HoxA-like transcriptional regulator protein [Halorhabdus tiamatea SARL4B]|uniref:HoxA-like transcriptional regulator protein n=1 Tax=Halorhabdus tiamatea SARL4B TaxID=1033806 RepID=U2FBE5_9EURY|nr:HalX domain-containing protein [Halorhabdus tiamatea]ERJ05744.1 HoxA-like transcriptional regulator protein [Halorhabdus tiamatea SARL4B]
MSASVAPIVLVVDDEPDVADAYAAQLEGEYSVLTAYSGQEALETLDDTVDVVLLDRRMPGLSGDDVLERIRDRGLDCRVAMVTAVDPDFDIIEMPFDAYITKPVSREELFETIERLLTFQSYEKQFQELYRVSSKVATLRSNKSETELAHNDAYGRLLDRRDELRERLDETIGSFDDDDFATAFKDFDEEA